MIYPSIGIFSTFSVSGSYTTLTLSNRISIVAGEFY